MPPDKSLQFTAATQEMPEQFVPISALLTASCLTSGVAENKKVREECGHTSQESQHPCTQSLTPGMIDTEKFNE